MHGKRSVATGKASRPHQGMTICIGRTIVGEICVKMRLQRVVVHRRVEVCGHCGLDAVFGVAWNQ